MKNHTIETMLGAYIFVFFYILSIVYLLYLLSDIKTIFMLCYTLYKCKNIYKNMKNFNENDTTNNINNKMEMEYETAKYSISCLLMVLLHITLVYKYTLLFTSLYIYFTLTVVDTVIQYTSCVLVIKDRQKEQKEKEEKEQKEKEKEQRQYKEKLNEQIKTRESMNNLDVPSSYSDYNR